VRVCQHQLNFLLASVTDDGPYSVTGVCSTQFAYTEGRGVQNKMNGTYKTRSSADADKPA